MSIPTDIVLYTEGTPNGLKISIALEELGLQYEARKMSIAAHEQKEPWFLEINPNGRIPALTDKDANGEKLAIWESGAMLQYLVARYDKDHKISYPYGTKEHWEVTSWLMWQMGGVGPMQGQANHFSMYANDKYPYSLSRYVNETRRLYRTMDAQLAKNPSGYLVGDRITIADIAVWPWITAFKVSGLANLDEFVHVKAYMYKLLERPGFERGRHVPTPHRYLKLVDHSEEDIKKLGAQNIGWIQEAMKRVADAAV
ncbi:glutathione S-transferase [Xylariomycetidae sp. FL2044]|nr:glutathione S-transferase [Xylariomycetidae sp. FL2044]